MLLLVVTQAEGRHSNSFNESTTGPDCSRPSDATYLAATPAAVLKRREKSTMGY